MRNVQLRRVGAPVDRVASLLDRLGGPDDELWPSRAWPALRLDRGLETGSVGGHGPVRYALVAYEPGRLARFRFDPRCGLDGTHELRVTADGPGATLLTHVLEGRTVGRGRVLWPVAIRWFHEALMHDLFDNAERLAAEGPRGGRARWSRWVRLLRAVAPRPSPSG